MEWIRSVCCRKSLISASVCEQSCVVVVVRGKWPPNALNLAVVAAMAATLARLLSFFVFFLLGSAYSCALSLIKSADSHNVVMQCLHSTPCCCRSVFTNFTAYTYNEDLILPLKLISNELRVKTVVSITQVYYVDLSTGSKTLYLLMEAFVIYQALCFHCTLPAQQPAIYLWVHWELSLFARHKSQYVRELGLVHLCLPPPTKSER